MNWKDEVDLELARAQGAERNGNQGRARTSARRAVGIAIVELQRRFPEKQYGKDFMTQLRSLASDPAIPERVRIAADRLQTKLSPEFESPSKHPIDDAGIIVQFILEQLSWSLQSLSSHVVVNIVPDVVILFLPERFPFVEEEERDSDGGRKEQEAGEQCKTFHNRFTLAMSLSVRGDRDVLESSSWALSLVPQDSIAEYANWGCQFVPGVTQQGYILIAEPMSLFFPALLQQGLQADESWIDERVDELFFSATSETIGKATKPRFIPKLAWRGWWTTSAAMIGEGGVRISNKSSPGVFLSHFVLRI
jgi:hypothetical protein